MSGNNGCPNDENALERMVRQTRALAGSPCEHEGEPCYGCSTCFARDTVRMLDAESAQAERRTRCGADFGSACEGHGCPIHGSDE